MTVAAIDRAHALLRLSPVRDGYEVYSVGRIETAPPYGTGYLCPACQEPIGPNQRFRQIRTREAGTSWTARMVHEVHEPCWLLASTPAGLQAILDRTVRP